MTTDESLKISIALATYNGERFLRRQLDSLLAQSVPFDELVVCDDCSTDSTADILREYAARDLRIKVTVNDRNLGFRSNFEKALRLCSGDLIALCDQDDIWLPGHLEILRDNIGDNLLIAGASMLCDNECEPHGVTLAHAKNFDRRSATPAQVFRFVAFYQNPFQGAAMMMRRDFLRYALPIPKEVKFHDVWFVHLASLMERFTFTTIPVILYRIHGNNASGEHRKTTRLKTPVGHLLKHELGTNRQEVISALCDRSDLFSDASKRLLDEAKTYYSSRSLGRRLSNLLFELKHFNDIYGRE